MVFLVVGIVDVDGHLHLVGLTALEFDGGRNGIVVAIAGVVGVEHQTRRSVTAVPEAGSVIVVVDDGPCFAFFVAVDDGGIGSFVCGTCKHVVRCGFLTATDGIGGHNGVGVVVDSGEVGVGVTGLGNAGSHHLLVGVAGHGVGDALTVVPSAVRAGFRSAPGNFYCGAFALCADIRGGCGSIGTAPCAPTFGITLLAFLAAGNNEVGAYAFAGFIVGPGHFLAHLALCRDYGVGKRFRRFEEDAHFGQFGKVVAVDLLGGIGPLQRDALTLVAGFGRNVAHLCGSLSAVGLVAGDIESAHGVVAVALIAEFAGLLVDGVESLIPGIAVHQSTIDFAGLLVYGDGVGVVQLVGLFVLGEAHLVHLVDAAVLILKGGQDAADDFVDFLSLVVHTLALHGGAYGVEHTVSIVGDGRIPVVHFGKDGEFAVGGVHGSELGVETVIGLAHGIELVVDGILLHVLDNLPSVLDRCEVGNVGLFAGLEVNLHEVLGIGDSQVVVDGTVAVVGSVAVLVLIPGGTEEGGNFP